MDDGSPLVVASAIGSQGAPVPLLSWRLSPNGNSLEPVSAPNSPAQSDSTGTSESPMAPPSPMGNIRTAGGAFSPHPISVNGHVGDGYVPGLGYVGIAQVPSSWPSAPVIAPMAPQGSGAPPPAPHSSGLGKVNEVKETQIPESRHSEDRTPRTAFEPSGGNSQMESLTSIIRQLISNKD